MPSFPIPCPQNRDTFSNFGNEGQEKANGTSRFYKRSNNVAEDQRVVVLSGLVSNNLEISPAYRRE